MTTGSFMARGGSLPLHYDAEILVLLLEQPLVGPADALRGNGVGHEFLGAQPPTGELAEEPLLGLVDVPGSGEPEVGRLEQHVPVSPESLDVPAVKVVVEVDF